MQILQIDFVTPISQKNVKKILLVVSEIWKYRELTGNLLWKATRVAGSPGRTAVVPCACTVSTRKLAMCYYHIDGLSVIAISILMGGNMIECDIYSCMTR